MHEAKLSKIYIETQTSVRLGHWAPVQGLERICRWMGKAPSSPSLSLGLQVTVNLLTPPDVDAIVGVWIVLAETEEYELLLL